MSKEYERRTWDDVKLFYLNKIDELTLENIKLKSHAVEVLAEEIAKNKFDVYDDKIEWRYPYGLKTAYMLEKEREECIKEARALLGWDNDNNDKEK